jgi:hypothetical protein
MPDLPDARRTLLEVFGFAGQAVTDPGKNERRPDFRADCQPDRLRSIEAKQG